MVLGDESDSTALWLTPSEIGGRVFQCHIGKWSQDSGGMLTASCGNRTFLIVPRKNLVPSVLIVDSTGEQPYPAYVLKSCELDE